MYSQNYYLNDRRKRERLKPLKDYVPILLLALLIFFGGWYLVDHLADLLWELSTPLMKVMP
jgi:hypothetical protein